MGDKTKTTKTSLRQRIEGRRPMDLQDTRHAIVECLFFNRKPPENVLMNAVYHLGALND